MGVDDSTALYEIDFFLPLLQEVSRLVDQQLEIVEAAVALSPDPDSQGVFDRGDYAAGVGFVVCQQYLVAHRGAVAIKKRDAFRLGPSHRCGEPIAFLVNGLANFWKHSAEPPLMAPTLQAVRALGVSQSEYTSINALHELLAPLPARFGTLIPFLTGWRDELHRVARGQVT